MIDLTEIVEATAREAYEVANGDGPAWDALAAITRHQIREAVGEFVTFAAPLIERQAREQVAREIEAEADGYLHSAGLDRAWIAGWRSAVAHVGARIVRGES